MLRSRAAVLCVILVATGWCAARAQGEPAAVWGAGPTDVWVVGATPHPLRHSTSGWAKLPLGERPPALAAVWAASPDEVFVGGASLGTGTVLRWDGRVWTPLPLPTRHPVVALQGRSGAEVYALARSDIPGRVPSVLRWDGRAWTDVPLPRPFRATALALHGDEVLVSGYLESAQAPGGARGPGVLARLRAGRWSVVADPAVAAARWDRVLVASETLYLAGEGPDGKTAIVASSGAAWTALPAPADDAGASVPVKLAFLAGDGTLVGLLTGGVGYARFADGRWVLVRPPDAYNPPPSLTRDELLLQMLGWGELGDARAAWGPTADHFYVLSGSRLVEYVGGAAKPVYDAECEDPAVASRSPFCRALRP